MVSYALGTAQASSSRRGIHPHTLSYRLNRLRERYGIDLDDYEVRLRVELALLILGATDGALRPEPPARQ